MKLLLSGFGVGLSWGVVEVNIDTENVFPMLVTNNYYQAGGLFNV